MVLPLPRLDDRSFDDLMQDAERIIRDRCPAWTDLSAGDPGRTLLEAFAYLTEVMLYRLNRIPEKVHIALLNLLGITMQPPSAATTRLVLSRAEDKDRELRLPPGQQVADKTGAVIFTLPDELILAPGASQAEVAALHAEFVQAELAGTGTGEGAQSVRLRRPPVLRRTETRETLLVGVEAAADAMIGQAAARQFDNKSFGLWQEVDSFFGTGAGDRCFMVDRITGVITFAPSREAGISGRAPTLVPAKGCEIRAWYWRGGGRAGNIGPDTLTTLRLRAPGLTVTNPSRAGGGEDPESLDDAIRRAQATVVTSRTAVTARDFERVALGAGGIARARAFAQRDRWVFAEAGIVEVQIVPRIAQEAVVNSAVTPEVLAEHQTADLLNRVEAELAARRPLGVRTVPSWTRCRPVTVSARIVVSPVESADDVHTRLLGRINRLLSPAGDWPFGRTLRASDIYEVILAEPGVRYAEQLRFRIEAGPENLVRDLIRDPGDGPMMFAATEIGLFRSLDLGRSWTLQQDGLPEKRVILARANPEMPGLVAAVVENEAGSLWTVCVSHDAGEHWVEHDRVEAERIYDGAWVSRDNHAVLMLGTRRALRRLQIDSGQGSVNVDRLLKGGSNGPLSSNGFYAVASVKHPSGVSFFAIAARERRGVFISVEGSEPGSFELLPDSEGKDVRILTFHRVGDRTFLWAGMAAEGGAQGEGLMRIEARATGVDPNGWRAFDKGWRGGSCEGIDFAGQLAVAASNHAGVLLLNLDAPEISQSWRAPAITCGLPINPERNALVPVVTVTAKQTEEGGLRILAGTREGLFESPDGLAYQQIGQTGFTEQVPLPTLWLYCSGPHELTVLQELTERER